MRAGEGNDFLWLMSFIWIIDRLCVLALAHARMAKREGQGEIMIDFTEAFKIAAEVHGNQRDKSGEPYMGHVCWVMSQMETDEERVVAIMHDVFEDSRDRPDLNRSVLARVKLFYRSAVYNAVLDMTHGEDESYEEYLLGVARNPLAVKVKLSYIRDNLDPVRLEKLSQGVRERLIYKYGHALTILLRKEVADGNGSGH